MGHNVGRMVEAYNCASSIYKIKYRRKSLWYLRKSEKSLQSRQDVEEITLETNVKEDLDADSLDLFQIINDIEDEFDVSVEDPESIVTVQDAVDFVEKNQK